MPKVDIRYIERSIELETHCPNCGGDELWVNPDTGLLECDWCEQPPIDDVINGIIKPMKQKKVIKKMRNYE